MTAERDAMTLNEVSYSALGAEERSDEAPRAGGAGLTPDPEVGVRSDHQPSECAPGQVCEDIHILAATFCANIVAESPNHSGSSAATAGTYRFASITCCAAAQGD